MRRASWSLLVSAVAATACVATGAQAVPLARDGRIVFQNFNGESYDIYAVNPNGGGMIDLTRTPSVDEFEPSWSPDGKRIAYAGVSVGGAAQAIFVMNADGRGRRKLVSGGLWQRSPAWSPDGKRIAFSECTFRVEAGGGDCSSAQIAVVGPGGQGLRALTRPSSGWLVDGKPAWSPDGRRIAFTRTPSFGVNSIWVVGADGKGLRKVLDDGSQADHNPSWSPDGRLLIYATDVSGPDSIFVADADGKNRHRVVVPKIVDPGSQGEAVANPVFAPSGRRIAFMFGGELWTAAPSGRGRRQLTREGGDAADWSRSNPS